MDSNHRYHSQSVVPYQLGERPMSIKKSRLRVPGVPSLCTRFPTAAARHRHGIPDDCDLDGMRLIWLQRRVLNSRSLAYETNGDNRSPTLQKTGVGKGIRTPVYWDENPVS